MALPRRVRRLGVLLLGTLDAGQLGCAALLFAAGCGVVAVIQAAVLAGRLRRPAFQMLVRVLAALLLFAALPVGYLLMVAAAFSTLVTSALS